MKEAGIFDAADRRYRKASVDLEAAKEARKTARENLIAKMNELEPPVLDVSRREKEVLQGICEGLANKEIAARLNISERTIKFHVGRLLAKYGAQDRYELRRRVENGLTRSPAP